MYHLAHQHLSVAAVFKHDGRFLVVREGGIWTFPTAAHCCEYPGLVAAANRLTRPLGVRIGNSGAALLGMYPPTPSSEEAEWAVLRLPVVIKNQSHIEAMWVNPPTELSLLGELHPMVEAVFAHLGCGIEQPLALAA